MTNLSKSTFKAPRYLKYVGLSLTLIGILTIILDNSQGSEIPLLVGLFVLLVTRDKTDDERSVQIRTTSLYLAFIISYGAKLITTNLHDHALISFELVEINHFLILMLALANVIFYSRLHILKH
jgi:hypothetical protein